MESVILAARWPGLVALALGGLLLLAHLLMPELSPRQMLRWGRGRVERAMVPLIGARAAPEVADAVLLAGGVTLVVGGALLVYALGPVGLLLAPVAALLAGWAVANRQAARRRERLAQQVQGLAQALAAGLTGEASAGGTVFALLRRFYRQMEPPLREEFGFMELVLRGQADLGEALERAAGEAGGRQVRALLELLALIYRESLELEAQRRALRTLLERIRQDDAVRRTVRVESRFGQTSQSIVLFLIPAFIVLAGAAGAALGSEVSVVEFYFRTSPGRAIVVGALLVEGLVFWISRRMMAGIRWE